MTMPAYNSFQLYKGDTLRFSLTLQTSGSAYIIPNGTLFSGAVKEKNTSSLTAEFDSDILSASTGKVLFTLDSLNSSLLSSNKNWIYDVQMTDSASTVTTLLTGNIFVTDEVTS
jgi:penicillin V acylase-like amidase (Ntn superfamily)